MGQSASAYEEEGAGSDGEGSYYSSEEEGSEIYTDEEEGYESEGSSVSLNDGDGGDGQIESSGKRSQTRAMSGKESRQKEKKTGGVRFDDVDSSSAAAAAAAQDAHTAAAAVNDQEVEPVDLEDLSANELLDRIDEIGGIGRDDLIAASRALRRGYHPSDQLQMLANVTGTKANTGSVAATPNTYTSAIPASPSRGFYVDDGHYAADVRIAMRVLAASEYVRHLRFKLVPARLKEPLFWAALLGMLKYGKGWVSVAEEERLECRAAAASVAAAAGGGQKEGEIGSSRQRQQQQQHSNDGAQAILVSPDVAAVADGGYREADELRKHLRQRDAEIAQLRRSLDATRSKVKALETEVAELEQRCSSSSAGGASSAATAAVAESNPEPTANRHKGSWTMDRDSQDFLALDEDLKANLRAEKAKRLKEVREQMRFILDTDSVACSNGEWSCCGRKEYGADGCV